MSDQVELASKALNGEQRAKCWAARDLFLQCLEDNLKTCIYKRSNRINYRAPEACAVLRRMLEAECPPLWVNHFEMKWAREKLQKMSHADFEEG